MNLTNNQLLEWWNNKSINPKTKRKIKCNSKKYKEILNNAIKKNVMNDGYHNFRGKLVDPLLHFDIERKSNVFKYKYCWNPYNGIILGKDPRGCLNFDPDYLIHYYYVNRLKQLWIKGEDNFTGTYGDALGNGPDFYIPGRGNSYHYYLFRLPLFNAFVDENEIGQQITLTPILTKDEIEKIYKLALKRKNNYKNKFNRERPNLLKIYKLYHDAISKPDYTMLSIGISEQVLKESWTLHNIKAIEELKKL